MPKWETNITVINKTGCDLKILSKSIPWGKEDKDKKIPDRIPKNGHGEIYVYAPAGTSTGVEFTVTYVVDGIDENERITFSVDIPYWHKKNSSSCTTTGRLRCDNFQEVKDGAHDYTTVVDVYLEDI